MSTIERKYLKENIENALDFVAKSNEPVFVIDNDKPCYKIELVSINEYQSTKMDK